MAPGEAAHAAHLDVDDAAGAEVERAARVLAPSGSTRRGRSGVASRRCSVAWSTMSSQPSGCSIIMSEKRVELARGAPRRRACRRCWRRPSAAASGKRARIAATERHVAAGLDLDLDAPVAGRHLAPRPCRASAASSRWRPTETPDAISPAAAAEHAPERHALAARPQLPDRHLERGLRHLVPAHAGEGGQQLARVRDLEREGQRARGSRAGRGATVPFVSGR